MERPRHSRRDSHLQCFRWLLRPPRPVGLVLASRLLSPPSGCCVLDLSPVLRILMLKTAPFACVQFLVRPQGPRFHSCGHVVHLSCVAHLRVNSRHMSCPFCRTGWTSVAEERFAFQCSAHSVSLPPAAPSYNTRSVPLAPESAPPPPPSSVTAFFCQHVALVDSSRADSDQAWVDLPSRHMAWMPVFNRGTGRWDPEWVCLRCNENLTGHHPLLQNVPVVPVCPAGSLLSLSVCFVHAIWCGEC